MRGQVAYLVLINAAKREGFFTLIRKKKRGNTVSHRRLIRSYDARLKVILIKGRAPLRYTLRRKRGSSLALGRRGKNP